MVLSQVFVASFFSRLTLYPPSFSNSTPVLSIATWVIPLANSHSFISVKQLMKVLKVRVSLECPHHQLLPPPPSSGRRYNSLAGSTEGMLR